ncbi:MAG TPA: nucleotidyltransferase domain-containing protein [Anaerolineales bacterium]|nr:nucleotidyltransferase domain-containing protein [Anaerolineales bacterium]
MKLGEGNFEPDFVASLPQTYALILSTNLTVHPAVARVILHGSRGLAGGYRPDSDIDLSLIVDPPQGPNMERQLQEVLEMTLSHWHAAVEPDLAVIFDIRSCALKCFDQRSWTERLCKLGNIDCFGLYKAQKGFSGLVTNAGIQVNLMYPCLKIWQRP